MKTLSQLRSLAIATIASFALLGPALSTNTFGQESSSWWPGATANAGGSAAATSDAAASTSGESKGWLMNSPLVNIGWPEIKMPKIQWNPMATGGAEGPGFIATQTGKIRTMASNAASKTRASWNNTVDKLRWNKPAKSGGTKQPGFFARLMTPPAEPQGAETVTEFLAQDRPGTIRK